MSRQLVHTAALLAVTLVVPLYAQDTERVLNLPETPYEYADPELPEHFQSRFVQRMDNTPARNPVTNHGATLGRVLFYDTKLSANNKTACASCHLQKHAFAERKRLSIGFDGKKVDRNAMSLVNARFYANGRFFWDERARTLEAQVLLPIQNKIEMGHDLDKLVSDLGDDPIYPPLFQQAFGDGTVTEERLADALAQFVRSLVSFQSKYDKGLSQTKSVFVEFPNFSKLENEGKQIFFGRANCASCHMSGRRGRRGGQQQAIFYLDGARNNGIDSDFKANDGGLGDVTLRRTDFGSFKSPSLRNVQLTAPYMHDGRLRTLSAVIDHYNRGVELHPNLDRRLSGRGRGRRSGSRRLNLTRRQQASLVAFLKTLTDRRFITDEKFSNPLGGHNG